MIKNLEMKEYSFDRRLAFLESQKVDLTDLSKEQINIKFLEFVKKQQIASRSVETNMTTEINVGKTIKDLVKDLKLGKSKVYAIPELKIKVQVKVVGEVEAKNTPVAKIVKTNGKK